MLSVLADVDPLLEPEARQEIQMYLDAGEYRLALEATCAVLKKKQSSVSGATYASLVEIGERTDVDTNYWCGPVVSEL